MATSGNRPFLKRCLEKELGIPNKRLKIDETELFCENRSDKAFRGVGRGERSWKSSYQRYKSRYYGSRKERNSFKTRIGKKRKEEVDIRDDIEKVDADTIEEIVVWQPTTGSEAFNEGFVSDLNEIEAFGEGGEVSNSVSVEDKGGKIIIFNDDDEEIFEVLEVIETFDDKLEEYLEDEEYDFDENNYNYGFGEDTEDNEITTKNDEISKKDEEMKKKK